MRSVGPTAMWSTWCNEPHIELTNLGLHGNLSNEIERCYHSKEHGRKGRKCEICGINAFENLQQKQRENVARQENRIGLTKMNRRNELFFH